MVLGGFAAAVTTPLDVAKTRVMLAPVLTIYYLTIGSCFSVHYRVMEHAGSLESTKEALVQSLNSPFFPPHIGAEPGRAKEESRITCMRMLRTPPFFPQIGGKTIFGNIFQIWLVARSSE